MQTTTNAVAHAILTGLKCTHIREADEITKMIHKLNDMAMSVAFALEDAEEEGEIAPLEKHKAEQAVEILTDLANLIEEKDSMFNTPIIRDGDGQFVGFLGQGD